MVDAYRRRLISVAFLRHVCIAAPAAALIAASLGLGPGGIAAAAACGVLAAALVAVLRAPTFRQTASAIDARLGLPDRMVAAFEFAGSPEPIDRLIVQSAARHLEGVTPATLFPVHASRRAAAGAVMTVATMVVAMWMAVPGDVRGGAGPGLTTGSSSPAEAGDSDTDTVSEPSGAQPADAVAAAGRPDDAPDGVPETMRTAEEAADVDLQADRGTRPDTDRDAAGGASDSGRGGSDAIARSEPQTSNARQGGDATPSGGAGDAGGAASRAADAPGAAGDAADTARSGEGAGGVGVGPLSDTNAAAGRASRASVTTLAPVRTEGDVEAALLRHDVPPHLRAYVRRYFSAMLQAGQE